MYSHKRSFTGQSSRSLASLFDLPFLATALIFNFIFSITHSLVTYTKLDQHIRAIPQSIQGIAPETLANALKYTAPSLNPHLIISLFLGLTFPLILISASVRFALANLRVSVQRTVTVCYLIIFYSCSALTVALQQPDWTPGNILIFLARPFGKEFFESVRAILCLSLIVATAVTLARNATSKANRRIRVFSFVVVAISLLAAEHFITEDKRSIHSSFLKSPSSARFIYVIPELTKPEVQESFKSEQLSQLKEQLTSFQEIEASTSSLAGQFATTFLGVEPLTHGIRHDQFGADTRLNVMEALSKRAFAESGSVFVANIGGTTSVAQLFTPDIAGQRCDNSLEQLAAIGHFQASVLPYSLLPRYFDRLLHPELACSTRFMNIEQHLLQLHQKIALELHRPGTKTFVIWVSEALRKNLPKQSRFAQNQLMSLTTVLLGMHSEFLELTGLKKFHQTYLVGLSGSESNTTVFARFDGQAQSTLTDLTLEFPGQRSQSSVSTLFKPLPVSGSSDTSYFYSEVSTIQRTKAVSAIVPRIAFIPNSRQAKLVVEHSELRAALMNGERHIICKNVVDGESENLSMVKVTLTAHPTGGKLPQLTYEPTPLEKPSGLTHQVALNECLENAKGQLINSLYDDVSLRDSAAFRTLLAGLPVRPIKAEPVAAENFDELEKDYDTATSALPAQPAEDLEY